MECPSVPESLSIKDPRTHCQEVKNKKLVNMCEETDHAPRSPKRATRMEATAVQQQELGEDTRLSRNNLQAISPPRRRRRRHPIDSTRKTAVDLPPPVASLSSSSIGETWSTLDCHAMTPEFMATLSARPAQELEADSPALEGSNVINWSTSPRIVGKQWLIIGTEQGHVCVWKASHIVEHASLSRSIQLQHSASPGNHREKTSADPSRPSPFDTYKCLPPDAMIDCCTLLEEALRDKRKPSNPRTDTCAAPIVSIATTLLNETSGMSQNYIVAITDTGTVAILRLGEAVQLVAGFSTRQCSATCCAMTTHTLAKADGSHHSLFRIMIGYQSGQLEGWELPVPRTNAAATFDQPSSRAPLRSASPAKLLFRGYWEESCEYEVRAVGPLYAHRRDSSDEALIHDDCLLLVLETATLDKQLPTPSMIEVINLTSLVRAWNENCGSKHTGQTGATKMETQQTYAEAMEPHLVLAEPGMEVVDVRSSLNRRRGLNDLQVEPVSPSWVPCHGTNCILSLCDVQNQEIVVTHTDPQEMFACYLVALSDGSGVVVSTGLRIEANLETSAVNNNGQLRLCWGVARAQDQMLFSFPAVGLGHLEIPRRLQSNLFDKATFPLAAFTLGGTTTYLAPLKSLIANKPNSLAFLSYPQEIDVDSPPELLQASTVGNLIAIAGDTEDTTPVIVYAWHGGGLLEVYSCSLLEGILNSQSIIAGLVENGAADLLRALLMANNIASLCASNLSWLQATFELEAAGLLNIDRPLTLEDVVSPRLRRFCALLMSFALKAT